MRFPDFIKFDGSIDGIIQFIVIIIVAAILIMNSTVFETQYGDKLIDLYLRPWWRTLIILLVITSVLWHPRVGIIVALVAFFYLSDMETLMSPLAITEK